MDSYSDSSLRTKNRSAWLGRAMALLLACTVALCMLAQPARAALQRSWTAVGFFEYVRNNTTGTAKNDAINALAVINSSTGSSVAGIASYTNVCNAYDASSLYCLYAGLTYLDYCNSIRSSRGLSAYGTNCTLEAMSIVMCNYAQRFGGHSNAYSSSGVHEALAWSSAQRSTSSVYQSWYYNESDSGSHRRNVIGSYNASGFAIAANGSGTMKYMYEQSFQKVSTNTKVYSISAFRQLLKGYISNCLAEGMPLGSLSSSEFSGTTTTVKNGLIVENNVTHGYNNGTMLVSAWGYFGGKYYHFDATGAMETETWKNYNGTWYWLGSDGAVVVNNWMTYDGKWYWFDEKGIIQLNTWTYYKGSWYWLGEDAAVVTSTWIQYEGKWYWLGASGKMAANTWWYYEDNWYYVDPDGALAQDTWITYKGTEYYFDADGRLVVE